MATNVAGLPLTLVTLRLTVCVPAMSPIAIDARFMSLGSITATPASVQNDVGSCVPHRKPSQSLKLESNTRPGCRLVRLHVARALAEDHQRVGVRPIEHVTALVINADLIAIGDQIGMQLLEHAPQPRDVRAGHRRAAVQVEQRPLLPGGATPARCPGLARSGRASAGRRSPALQWSARREGARERRAALSTMVAWAIDALAALPATRCTT
jgi:hypothetical protein